MLTELKMEVLRANIELGRSGLVIKTWGNVSGINRAEGMIAIKPSGINYDELTVDDIVIVDLEGKIVEGNKRPSSDTAAHIELYRAFPQIGGVAHTHSSYATVFSQACIEIECYGTTHADHFSGTVPVTRFLTKEEIDLDYEKNTGLAIVERFRDLDYISMPGVLSAGHAPFTWGTTANDALSNSIILERVAMLAYMTKSLNPLVKPLPEYIEQKHYNRKHGPGAYYGQKN